MSSLEPQMPSFDDRPNEDDEDHELDEPLDRRQPRVTTFRRAIVLGAIAVLVVGAGSSLATASLTDRQPDLEAHRAENSALVDQVRQSEARNAALAGEVEPIGGAHRGARRRGDGAGDKARPVDQSRRARGRRR